MINLEEGIEMGYDSILYIFYDTEKNIFYEDFYNEIYNIFDFLTTNDIFLFRRDPGNCVFPHRYDRKILCEILVDYYDE
jgi:hypothetical protein